MKVVIVGNGIAGNQVAFSIRERCRDTDICIVSAENVPEYDPCSLPYFLGGDCEELAVFRKSAKYYTDNRIELMVNSRIASISPDVKTIMTENGTTIAYDKLVLAHGGDLFIPPIDGIHNPGVFSCKQFHEALRLRSHKGTRAVVIGSGAIGIEAAEALKKKGYEVTIIELLDWILPALFDEATAKRLESAMEGYGIQVRTGEKVLRINGDETVTGVTTDKRDIPCDTVVVATGVVPGVALAQTAGIATERGIQVDRYMQTSVPDIYACGDCVETIDACTGEMAMFQLKHNAIEQGKIVARNILGDKELIEREDGDDYLRIVLLDGKVVGGQAIGNYADSIGFFIGAMWRKDDMNHLRRKVEQMAPAGAAHSWHQIHMGRLMQPAG